MAKKMDALTSLTTIVGIVSTLAAVVVGYSECSRKDTEIELAKTKVVEELLPALSDSNSEKRRYAFSTLLLLYSSNKDEKDKQSLLSFGEAAMSLQDAEALEAVSNKLHTFSFSNDKEEDTINKFTKKAAQIYALRARTARYEAASVGTEIEKIKNDDDKKNLLQKKQELLLHQARNVAEKAVELNSKDTQTLYELGRLMQENGEINNAIDKFEKIFKIYERSDIEKNDEIYRRSNLNLAVLYKQMSENSNREADKIKYRGETKKFYDITKSLFGRTEPKYLDKPKNEPEFYCVGLWFKNKPCPK